MLNFNDVKEYANNHLDLYFEKDGSGKGYICPICSSGSGKNGTGLSTKDGKHFTCWAGCFSNADIIDIVAKELNIENASFKEKMEALADRIGYNDHSSMEISQPAPHKPQVKPQPTEQEIAEQQEKNRKLINLGIAHVQDTDYLLKRGIDLNTSRMFNLGYVANYRGMGEAITIPVNMEQGKHIARFINPAQNKYYYAGSREPFNATILYMATQPIVITEGELDAISIVRAGGNAIGLGGVTGRAKLLEKFKEQLPTVPLIIGLDNDEHGEKAANELMQGLANIGFKNYIKINLYGKAKDANEALTTNKEMFFNKVKEVTEAIDLNALELLKQKDEYTRNAASSYINDFFDIIKSKANTSYIPTGFPKLDKMLNGGLTEGLYTVGAVSSLGKTTMMLQIADNIARGNVDNEDKDKPFIEGHDVLVFSMEMSKMQLVAKSISRESFKYCIENKVNYNNAKTAKGITTGSRYKGYNFTEKEVIKEATKRYGQFAHHIYILESEGMTTVTDIRKAIQKHIDMTGNAPVVIIDYLQLLAPAKAGMNEKQTVDFNISELKRISRTFGIPLIAISSLNRSSYEGVVSMKSFKESGLIEYSSDILIGLNYEGQDKDNFDLKKAKQAMPRRIELTVLKNKEGETDTGIIFEYFPLFNYFDEV